MVQTKDWKKDETRANLMKMLQQLDHQPASADEAIASPAGDAWQDQWTGSFDGRAEPAFSPAYFSVQRALVFRLKHGAPGLNRHSPLEDSGG